MTRSLRILVVDTDFEYSVGGSFVRGFRRLGHEASFFDQFPFLGGGPSRLLTRAARRLVRPLAVPALNAALLATAALRKPDLVLVLKGQHLWGATLQALKRHARFTAVFHTDDLRNPGATSKGMVDSLRHWDAVFTPRQFAVDELRASGAKAAAYLPFGYDPERHSPAPATGLSPVSSKVVFVGTWAPERPALLERCAARFPFAIWGGGWERLTSASPLNTAVEHRAVYGDELREIVTTAAINLALLRKANRDQHTMRTFEIPACRGFMLAERTQEHRALYEEDREAVFFEGAEELEAKVERYLQDGATRARIAEEGYRRLVNGHHTYIDRGLQILQALELSPRHSAVDRG